MLKHMLNASGVAGCNNNARTNANGNRNSASCQREQRYHRPTPAALSFNQSFDSHHAHTSPGTTGGTATTGNNGHFPLLNLSAISTAALATDMSKQQQQAHAIYAKPMKMSSGNAPAVATTSALMNGTAVNVNATTLRPVPVIPVQLSNTSVRAPYTSTAATKLNTTVNGNTVHVPSPCGHRQHMKQPHLIGSQHAPYPCYPYPYPTSAHTHTHRQHGIKEVLVSLVLLCLVSLLLALLSLIFLLKIAPVTASDIREVLRAEQLTIITAEEYVIVYEVTLALCALALSLNLCCLLVCAIQFLFAVKLIKSMRTNMYLQKASLTRVCAVGGFFVSIPVFLTGIILYTFIQFHSTPAIVTSAFIGLGIVFCGCAMVHNVLIWQREKTNAVRERAQERQEQHGFGRNSFHNISAPIAGRLSNSGTCSCATDGVALANFLHSTMSGSPLHTHNHTLPIVTAQHPMGLHHSGSSGGNPIAALSPAHLREASGGGSSVSPAATNMAANMANVLNGLDLSSVATTTNSTHELSTLV